MQYTISHISNILSDIFAIYNTLYSPIYLQYKISYIANIHEVLQICWTLDFEFFNSEKRQYIANILSNIFAIYNTLYCPIYLQYKISYIANMLDLDFEFV